jgi:hypothetical protein
VKSVAILTGWNTHLDHLGVLCSILQIPLLITEENIYHLAKKYYPDLNSILCDPCDLTLEYLANTYDVIFETGKFWAQDLTSSLELFYQKKMRFVFCPHGNSDKGHSIEELISQDISLVYGDHLLNLLKHNSSLQKIRNIVRTGNYRLPYYLRHKTFYDALAEKEIFSHFTQTKPIVLYAPTWSNKENPSSFFPAIETLIEQLASDFNLLIKLHPILMQRHLAHVIALISRYENCPSALFLPDFPPIYPLLDKTAVYIGDYSSIGYDFLAYDKPLFFLPSQKCAQGYESPLFQCGTSLFPEELPRIKQKILESFPDPYSAIRQKTYRYAFGEEKSFEELRADINKLLWDQ